MLVTTVDVSVVPEPWVDKYATLLWPLPLSSVSVFPCWEIVGVAAVSVICLIWALSVYPVLESAKFAVSLVVTCEVAGSLSVYLSVFWTFEPPDAVAVVAVPCCEYVPPSSWVAWMMMLPLAVRPRAVRQEARGLRHGRAGGAAGGSREMAGVAAAGVTAGCAGGHGGVGGRGRDLGAAGGGVVVDGHDLGRDRVMGRRAAGCRFGERARAGVRGESARDGQRASGQVGYEARHRDTSESNEVFSERLKPPGQLAMAWFPSPSLSCPSPVKIEQCPPFRQNRAMSPLAGPVSLRVPRQNRAMSPLAGPKVVASLFRPEDATAGGNVSVHCRLTISAEGKFRCGLTRSREAPGTGSVPWAHQKRAFGRRGRSTLSLLGKVITTFVMSID